MQFILPLVYSLIFILLIYKIKFFNLETISRTGLVFLFILKLLTGCVVYLVYTKYYPLSDFHTYFSDSKILVDQWLGKTSIQQMQSWNSGFDNLMFNNSRVVIVLNAILQLFSFGNIFVHIVFFCFFSFAGITAIYKSFIFHFPTKRWQLIISVFFVPSILFWSSAPLKESLVVTLVGLLVYKSDFGLKPKYNYKEGAVLIILYILLALVKIHIAIALLPALIANYLIAKTSAKRIALKYLSVFMVMILFFYLVKIVHPDYNVLQLIADKQAKAISEAKGGVFLVSDKNFVCVDYNQQENILLMQKDSSFKIRNGSAYMSWKFDNMADTTFVSNSNDTATYSIYYSVPPAKTVLELKRLKPNLIDFIKYSPYAIITVIIQPTLFNIKSWLHLLVAVENLWLVLIILLGIVFYDKEIVKNKAVIAFCLVFALIIFDLIGITTPVIGAMVRYRTIGLLFFIPVILMMIDEEKIKRRLFKMK